MLLIINVDKIFLIHIGIMEMHLRHAVNKIRRQSKMASSYQITGEVNESSVCAKTWNSIRILQFLTIPMFCMLEYAAECHILNLAMKNFFHVLSSL